ncbi:MAG: HAD-IA family hydrolase [Anaerolineae bacterium]|nr:HAD-IA family hydrolase [Anaerolineae bacterium]
MSPKIAPTEVEAILFDLDGTLIDTDDGMIERAARWLQPLVRLFPQGDPKRVLRRAIMASEGPTNAFLTFLDILGLDDELFTLGDRLRRLRGLRTPTNFQPVDGVVEAVQELSGRYPLGIVTTRSRQDAQTFLEQHALADCFSVVVAHEDTWRLKPHPEPIRYAAEQLGVAIERCLMVGDTGLDVRAAKAAGACAVGVLCGFGERGDLVGADLILETTAELGEQL